VPMIRSSFSNQCNCSTRLHGTLYTRNGFVVFTRHGFTAITLWSISKKTLWSSLPKLPTTWP
jgi:hypothetical protein